MLYFIFFAGARLAPNSVTRLLTSSTGDRFSARRFHKKMEFGPGNALSG
jgi:hypothetical protein